MAAVEEAAIVQEPVAGNEAGTEQQQQSAPAPREREDLSNEAIDESLLIRVSRALRAATSWLWWGLCVPVGGGGRGAEGAAQRVITRAHARVLLHAHTHAQKQLLRAQRASHSAWLLGFSIMRQQNASKITHAHSPEQRPAICDQRSRDRARPGLPPRPL